MAALKLGGGPALPALSPIPKLGEPEPAAQAGLRFVERYRGCGEGRARAARLTAARLLWRAAAPTPEPIRH